jgi:P-type Mg2+ transporter
MSSTLFANILKYIGMGASSSFGNMFSVLGASIFVPYLPMTPIQILTNNLLYDVSQTAIPSDEVDPEQIAGPRPWTWDRSRGSSSSSGRAPRSSITRPS